MRTVVSESFWQDRPTLVTGATGFVGSRLVMKLVQRGARVVSLARGRVSASELLRSGAAQQIAMVQGDVCDRVLLEDLFRRYEFDTVIHLAAQAIVTAAARDPISTFESNVTGTWCLLDVCRRFPCARQIITASSDKAYGPSTSLPYTEDAPLLGEHPYDVSKASADAIARAFAACYGLPVVVTRCANLFGGGDFNFDRIVPGTIRSVLQGSAPTIRSDGKFVRDFLYIDDGADAYMALVEELAHRPELRGQAFNFSLNEPTEILDLVHRILALMGSDLRPTVLNQVSHELRAQHLSADKARQLLGWQPAFSLEQGLLRTIAWYRELFAGAPAQRHPVAPHPAASHGL